jgi:VWFA-related protein
MSQVLRFLPLVTALALCTIQSSVIAQQAGSPQPKPAADEPAAGQAPGSDPQQPGAEQPGAEQPIFRAGINFVRVDVIVTDRQGNSVADLTQDDFEVSEDGKPQTIESFKFVKLDAISRADAEPARPIRSDFDEEREAARDDVRLFAIFLDDYHVRRANSMTVRDPLIKFIQTQLLPTDMIAVMYPLTTLAELRFTRNHDVVARAVSQFDGRKYDYTPKNEFEQRYAFYPATVVERLRNEVSFSGLRALVTRLGSLREGRKSVILVSEGYSNVLPPQLRDPVAGLPGYGNPDRGNPMAGERDPRGETMNFFANTELLGEMRRIFEAANRNNTAIYTLDPRGLAVGEFDIDQNIGLQTDRNTLRQMGDTLRVIAEETDGRAIVDRNDLEVGLRQITRDSSAYYLVGYNSTQAPSDGKFHKIEVRIKRPGVQVRARPGYWALTAEDTAKAIAPKAEPPKAVTRALGTLAEPTQGGRTIRTWVGMARGEQGKTRVTFVWEPTPAVPGVRREEAVRVALLAAGQGRPYFRGRVPDVALASADPGAAAATSPTNPTTSAASPTREPSQVTFDVDPGRLQLNISVEGGAARVIDTATSEVSVPDLTAPQVALSTPRVLRARNAFEYRGLVANPDSVPTASRDFRRTDRLLIRFESYGPGQTSPAVTARLLNRTGQIMAELPVVVSSGAERQIDLPLASMAPGEYLIEITAKEGEASTTEVVPIRLTS